MRGKPTENVCEESGFKVFGNLSFEVLRPTRKVVVKLTCGMWIDLARCQAVSKRLIRNFRTVV